MYYTKEDIVELLQQMPEEQRRLLAAEAAMKDIDITDQMIPILQTYMNAMVAVLEHAEAMYKLLLPGLKHQAKQWEKNEAALGLKPRPYVEAVKELHQVLSTFSA